MKTKTVAVLAVIVIVVAVLAVAAIGSNDDESDDNVTYHGNGGLLNGNSTYVLKGSSIESCLFELSNKSFKEWNTKADGSGTAYSVGDKAPSGKLDLYAQWGWKLSYSGSFGVLSGLGYYLTDGQTTAKITSSSTALPDSGRCSMLIMGGSNWTLNQEKQMYSGTNSDQKGVTNVVTINGAIEYTLSIVDDTPCITFTYNGPVSIDISEMISGH